MITRLAVAAAFLPVVPVAFAEQDSQELNPVVVTATRTSQTVDSSLASVTVITRADIDRLQPVTIQDLLVGLPGISVANGGGPGKPIAVYLRGTSNAELLVLLDGIKIGSATSGTAPLEQIPVDQIERIEIVRGPRSSLYGSDAIGGVMQIFTRKGSKTFMPSFSVTGGTYDTWQQQAGLSGAFGKAWYSGSVSGFQTKGINATTPQNPDYEPDADGYWNASGSLRGGYRFDNGAEVSADWLRVYGHNHYDGFYQSPGFSEQFANEDSGVQQVLGTTAKLPQWGIWQPSLSVGQTEDNENDFGGDGGGPFNTLRNTAGWQNDLTFSPNQQLIAGVDYLKDHVFSSTAYDQTSRENYGSYAQYQGGFGAGNVQLSVRNDHNQQFGTHWTGAGGFGYDINRDVRVMATYAAAFRAPTFNDLYYPADSYGDKPNPLLRPEKSVGGELGLSGRPGVWNWSINAYETMVSDLIEFVTDPNTFESSPQNRAHARLLGAEGQLGARWNHWKFVAYANYLDARDRSADADNHLLTRRPSQTARIDVDRDFGRFFLGSSLNASGRTFDDADNSAELGGYATVDLRGGLRFLPEWEIDSRLSNLLDKHYETIAGYSQPGRAVYFTLLYRPTGL